MNNVANVKKDECCGCTACYVMCPSKAIRMIPDEEGFLYPHVDESECINCGLCLRTCKNVYFYDDKQIVYALRSKNLEVRKRSSSGGAFSHIASSILDKGGFVCAVGYSEDKEECMHILIHSHEEIDNLRRAKFVQSNKGEIFKDIRTLLEKEKPVLFCGTPCEVNGLRGYLRKDYDNLLTCDLICGCVSSPLVYKTYIEFMKNKYNDSITEVNFKDKRKGWREKGISIKFSHGQEYYNSILDDDYVVSFHSRYNIRPSCFNCKCRSIKRVSDITLGDFWGIENYHYPVDDNIGISFVLANTQKGISQIEQLDNDVVFQCMVIDIEEYANKYNWCLHKNPMQIALSEERAEFFRDVLTMPFDIMAKKDLEVIRAERKKRKLRQKE